MTDKQLDFGCLVIPTLESDSDDCVLSESIGLPALSPSSSAKSILSLEQISEEDIGQHTAEKAAKATEELIRFFAISDSPGREGIYQLNGQCPHIMRRHRNLQTAQEFEGVLPPPRRFYRRFWLGLSNRLVNLRNGYLMHNE